MIGLDALCVVCCDPMTTALVVRIIITSCVCSEEPTLFPRVKIINHAVLSSGAAYPHMADIKHVVYSHEDVRSRYSLILRIGL